MHYRAPLGCRMAWQMALGEPVAGGAEVARGDKAGSDVRFCSAVHFFLACVSFFSYNMRCKVRLADVADVLDWSSVPTVVHRVCLFCLEFRKVNLLNSRMSLAYFLERRLYLPKEGVCTHTHTRTQKERQFPQAHTTGK